MPYLANKASRWGKLPGLLVIILTIVLCLALNRSVVMARVYTSLSAYHLVQAVVGQEHSPSHLRESWVLALKALQLQPESVSAVRLALRALAEDSQLQGADFIEPSRLLAGADDLSILYAGQVVWKSGDHQRAIGLWRLGKDTEYYFVHLGDQAYGRGDVQSALSYYETSRAIDDVLDSRKLQMYSNRCEYETRQQSSTEAVLWCSRAVEVQRTVWTLLALGQAFYAAGDYDTALSTLEEARILNPSVAGVYYRAGLTSEKLGQVDRALAYYEKGLELTPSDQYLNWAAGRLYEQTGQLQRAYCCYLQVATHGSSQSLVTRANRAVKKLAGKVSAQPCGDR